MDRKDTKTALSTTDVLPRDDPDDIFNNFHEAQTKYYWPGNEGYIFLHELITAPLSQDELYELTGALLHRMTEPETKDSIAVFGTGELQKLDVYTNNDIKQITVLTGQDHQPYYSMIAEDGKISECPDVQCVLDSIKGSEDSRILTIYGQEWIFNGKTINFGDYLEDWDEPWKADLVAPFEHSLNIDTKVEKDITHTTVQTYYKNGQLYHLVTYLENDMLGIKDGLEEYYSHNGLLLRRTNWINGTKSGLEQLWWLMDHQPLITKYWFNGQQVSREEYEKAYGRQVTRNTPLLKDLANISGSYL